MATMANRLEDKIRDYLADHLELLETGLQFVDKEYELPSSLGAGGRIDLLARDICGNVVLIEIKRSDQAARDALHEIHKYTALFRISQGLDESRIRLMVVSTEWHELRLPLSEFAGTTPYSVEAISITVLPDGVITHVSKVELLKKVAALKISRAQCIYLYQTARARDDHLDKLVDTVKAAGVEDFSIFRCDYLEGAETIMFPYGYYLCFSSPTLNLPSADLEQLKARIEWEDDLDEPDDNFVAYVNMATRDLCESLEIGYPEKLTNLHAKWSVSVLVRSGRFDRNQSVVTDEEIIALAQNVDGSSPIYLGKISSPRFKASWKQLRADLELVLRGNDNWQEIVPLYLDEVEGVAPTATVSIAVYNPTNLFFALYSIACNRDYSKCPCLEIVVEDSAAGLIRTLIGVLAWNGQEILATPSELINQVYGDETEWLAAVAMHGTFEEEDAALSAHHLAALTVEWRLKANQEIGPKRILVENGQICRRPFSKENWQPIEAFAQAHPDYLAALNDYVKDRVSGLA
jgi:hypothetical protein